MIWGKIMKLGKISSILSVAALSVGGLLVTAPASLAAPCGYWEDASAFYYNHCTSGKVRIQIDYPINNTTQCVGPGNTLLQWRSSNPFTNPTNAFYIGSC